jgi:hypothetical protein
MGKRQNCGQDIIHNASRAGQFIAAHRFAGQSRKNGVQPTQAGGRAAAQAAQEKSRPSERDGLPLKNNLGIKATTQRLSPS